MKSGSAIIRLAWILVGLLAIASAAFELGQPKTKEEPFASSFDPSGAAAFAELLRQDGYQVQIDNTVPTSLRPNVFAIAFVPRGEISAPLEENPEAKTKSRTRGSKSGSGEDSDTEPFTRPSIAPAAIRLMNDHLRSGGNALVLGYDPSIDLTLNGASQIMVTDLSSRSYGLSLPPGIGAYSEDFAFADGALAAWQTGDERSEKQPFANLDQVGSGRAVILGAGELAMNSYIDLSANATLLLDQVHLLAPRGSNVDFIDGSLTGSSGGLLDVLGPWAQGVRVQLILLCLVIVYTLGKRFGLADETIPPQRGARDLLDGIADTYDRGSAAKAGLQAVLYDADRAIRIQLKLPSDAPVRKRNELLPPAAVQALTACEHALMQDIDSSQALTLARNLETELDLFLPRRKPTANRARRRVKSA